MLDSLVHFHNSMPAIFRWSFDFIFNVVLLRGIMAHKLASWILREIRQREFFADGILETIMKYVKEWTSIARKVAIVQHYRHGHESDGVIGCTEENCSLFTEPHVNRIERSVIA